MERRTFLTSLSAAGTIAVAGCSDESDGQNDQQTSEESDKAYRYFFKDETGALGELAENGQPGENDKVVTNTHDEEDYEEMQENDTGYAKRGISDQYSPNHDGYDTSIDEIIDRTAKVYENPEENLTLLDDLGIDASEEDDEITFVRSLIRATQKEGVDSSGMASNLCNNLAEHVIEELNLDFNDFKLSSLYTTKPMNPREPGFEESLIERDGERSKGTGLRHWIGFLQYQKNGETQVKYCELTDAEAQGTFRHVIRNPEDSIYRSDLEKDWISTTREGAEERPKDVFPEHYVTVFDYSKARELESEGILGIESRLDINNGVGGYLIAGMINTVDDTGPHVWYKDNPDVNHEHSRDPEGLMNGVVSNSFGESVEEYVTDPTPEKRQRFREISRGLLNVYNEEDDWSTKIAVDGTLEDPEVYRTDVETINQIRADEAYDEVRERVTG
jgi:hypothetical protein